MKHIILKRIASNEYATYGVLIDDENDTPFAVTLELPWNDNLPEISCIPLGWYNCRRINSPKFGNVFEIKDVKGRTHILFHKGNIAENTEGCVLLGEAFDPVKGKNGITYSGHAYNQFMELLKDEEKFTLQIKGI